MVLTMTAPLVAQVPAPALLAPATMLPPLNDTQSFTKWILKVRAILHAKRWNGITTHNTESLTCESLSSELYMLLINFLDGDMLEPYIQSGPTSFANQGILMLHDLLSTHQSSSSAGLVSVFTLFLQARILPTATIIQYCSKIRGLSTELWRLDQPISEPLLRLLVVHSLTPKFADFASQVSTGVIDVVHGFNSWDAFIRHLHDYATRLNIRPAPSTATSVYLIWIGQPGVDKNQANRLMTLFTCPIHRSNDNTLDRCGSVKCFFAVYPNTHSTHNCSTGRDGGSGTHDSDGGRGRGRGRGRGYQRRSDSDLSTDVDPSHAPRLPQDS
jgi:hypothetical protein